MRVIVGVDTEYPWRESHRCSEESAMANSDGVGADKYLLTALRTDYFLLFQEAVTENKNGFARSMKI